MRSRSSGLSEKVACCEDPCLLRVAGGRRNIGQGSHQCRLVYTATGYQTRQDFSGYMGLPLAH